MLYGARSIAFSNAMSLAYENSPLTMFQYRYSGL
jgi:hypothetical protein